MSKKRNFEQRDTILRESLRLYSQEGIRNVTLAEIAEASGISKSLLQAYYKKKEDIVLDNAKRTTFCVFRFLSENYKELAGKNMADPLFFSAAECLLFFSAEKFAPCALFDLYADANLVQCCMDMSAKTFGDKMDVDCVAWRTKLLLPSYVFIGTMSTLLTSVDRGALTLRMEDCLRIALTHYYADIGLSEQDGLAIFEKAREFSTDAAIAALKDYTAAHDLHSFE